MCIQAVSAWDLTMFSCTMATCMSTVNTVKHTEKRLNIRAITWIGLSKNSEVTQTLSMTGANCNSWDVRPFELPEKYHPTNWIVSESIRFLKRRDPSVPFFLKMSFEKPHAPLNPPKYFYDLYMDKLEGTYRTCISETGKNSKRRFQPLCETRKNSSGRAKENVGCILRFNHAYR